jgi:protein phosphatase
MNKEAECNEGRDETLGGSMTEPAHPVAAARPAPSAAHGELPELSWAFLSHPGAQRLNNEDFVGAYVPSPDEEEETKGALFVLADGMGGHAAGEVASRMAVETLLKSWAGSPSAPAHQAIRSAVRSANAAVFAASLDQAHSGMGTTVVALTISGNEAHVGHVGDSRAYLVRGKQCAQLTSDHSRVAEMLRMRLITPEQAATHPARAQLTRSLGATPSVRVDVTNSLLERHDALVLCSDGLWDLVSRSEIAAATARVPASEAAGTLLDLALGRGAPDNVTVVVVAITCELPAAPSPLERSWLPFFRRNRDNRSAVGPVGEDQE